MILCFLNLDALAGIIAIISFIYLLLAVNTKVFRLTGRISYKLLFKLFGRYGKVVSKQDWKIIKKYCKKEVYKKLVTKKSKGYCYYYSRVVATFLKDAQLMYCSIRDGEEKTAHAVVVKNNCVYDTNLKKHFNLDEYIDKAEVDIYKMFSAEEYLKDTFFSDIREDFKKWCSERKVYCDPQ